MSKDCENICSTSPCNHTFDSLFAGLKHLATRILPKCHAKSMLAPKVCRKAFYHQKLRLQWWPLQQLSCNDKLSFNSHVLVDGRSGAVFAAAVAKGVNEHAIHTAVEALRFTGRQKVVLQTDAEPSIEVVADGVGVRWGKEAQIQTAPRESHASNGAAERVVFEISRQIRTIVNALEMRCPQFRLTVSSNQYSWIVRHSSWLLTRFLIKSDGKTACERLRGREYKGKVAEVVPYRLAESQRGKLDSQTSVGVWIGKSYASDENYIGASEGIRRCRSIWRRPENKRWGQSRLEKMKGVPWQPKGTPTVMPGTPRRGSKPR